MLMSFHQRSLASMLFQVVMRWYDSVLDASNTFGISSLEREPIMLNLGMMPDESRPTTSDFHFLRGRVHGSDAPGLPGPQEVGSHKTGLASHCHHCRKARP